MNTVLSPSVLNDKHVDIVNPNNPRPTPVWSEILTAGQGPALARTRPVLPRLARTLTVEPVARVTELPNTSVREQRVKKPPSKLNDYEN
jgi:hypothetical protein